MEKWTMNGRWYFPTSSGFPGGCTMTGGGDDTESMDLDLLGSRTFFFWIQVMSCHLGDEMCMKRINEWMKHFVFSKNVCNYLKGLWAWMWPQIAWCFVLKAWRMRRGIWYLVQSRKFPPSSQMDSFLAIVKGRQLLKLLDSLQEFLSCWNPTPRALHPRIPRDFTRIMVSIFRNPGILN